MLHRRQISYKHNNKRKRVIKEMIYVDGKKSKQAYFLSLVTDTSAKNI